MIVVDGLLVEGEPESKEHSEWLTDKDGRRYRYVGRTKEYEMMIRVDGIEIPQSELKDYNRRKREAAERQKPKEQPVYFTDKICPFKISKNSMRTACNRACAFFDNGCILAKTDKKPQRETKGDYCPITRTCKESCALYQNGCTLTNIIKGERSN